MGHAGAIIAGKAGTADAKKAALRAAGAMVTDSPSQIGETCLQQLRDAGLAVAIRALPWCTLVGPW